MTARRLVSGSIFFPRRGLPPPDQEGYTRDPGDAFLFHPTMPDCNKRTTVKGGGCCGSDRLYCVTLKRTVVPSTCNQCGASEAWITEQVKKYG